MIAVGPTADGEVEDQPGTGAFTMRADDDLGNSAAIREQIPLHQHRIPQLGANFVIAGAAVAAGQIP